MSNTALSNPEHSVSFDYRGSLLEDIRNMLVYEVDHMQRKIHEAEQQAHFPDADLRIIATKIKFYEDKINEFDEENQQLDSMSNEELELLRKQVTAKTQANKLESEDSILDAAEIYPVDARIVQDLEDIKKSGIVRPTKLWLVQVGEGAAEPTPDITGARTREAGADSLET